MKNPNRETVSKLEALPNLGKAISSDLRSIGISEPKHLIGKDPFDLYDKLCIKKGKHIDHCVIDVFMSVVDFMEGEEPQPWWKFTQKRKEILTRNMQ
ncbi:MAG: helix-hairpin-helix domain-containing protein [Campylobacterota bacterium]|nr:helix-hairpin-helix domain-containing protein [Campylobacterota bacterium]